MIYFNSDSNRFDVPRKIFLISKNTSVNYRQVTTYLKYIIFSDILQIIVSNIISLSSHLHVKQEDS